MKLARDFAIDGKPILGTYVAATVEDLAHIKAAGMNSVIGGKDHLDLTTDVGKFCAQNDIRVMYHMTTHPYGTPRIKQRIDAEQTMIPLMDIQYRELPAPGRVVIDDETITYGAVGDHELLDCTRGAEGTSPAGHREGIILYCPDMFEAEINEVKDSPNLWAYYVLDDSPGDALSALQAMYAAIGRLDKRPVVGGFGSAGAISNFGPGVCDIMLLYWYPVSPYGYNRLMTSNQTQWIMAEARKQVPGQAFIGVYQTYGEAGCFPTGEQVREQMEDFVREGACGLVSFLCHHQGMDGWVVHDDAREAVSSVNHEILDTGELVVRPEPELLKQNRVQPVGIWDTPVDVPGVPPAWHVLCQFDGDAEKKLDVTYPPDNGVDLDAVYEGRNGDIRWEPRRTCGGVIEFGDLMGAQNETLNAMAFATMVMTNSESRTVQMRFGSDEDAIVWMNDEQVWRHDGTRGVERDEDIVEITLPKGELRFLTKVYNKDGMWGFAMRFTELDGSPATGLEFSPETW
jgi:hypothetical protein